MGLADVLLSLAPVLLLFWLGLADGEGVVLLAESVVVVIRLGGPGELLPTVAGTVGEACLLLVAAVAGLGVGVDLVLGVVVALPVIVTVMGELASQGDCADQARCFTVGGVAAALSTVLDCISSWLDTVTLVCFKRETPKFRKKERPKEKIRKKEDSKDFRLPFYYSFLFYQNGFEILSESDPVLEERWSLLITGKIHISCALELLLCQPNQAIYLPINLLP